MESLSIGRVVLAPFPYSDFTDSKLRPCLIVGLADFNDAILCQITSKYHDGKNAISLDKNDFNQGTIIIDSFIRPDKVVTLDHSIIARSIGTITQDKVKEVKESLVKIFELDKTV